MVHTVLLMVTTSVVIAVSVGLVIYVATANPRQPISWIFSLLCLIIASIYLSNLFLESRPEAPLVLISFLLRWRWAAVTFSSTLYLHSIFFYFPPAWQRYGLWILLPIYLVSVSLGLMILFTNLVVAGFHYHAVPHIIGPNPGPFMPLVAGFFILEIIGGVAGLVVSYRIARTVSFRRHIFYLLMPTGLILLGSLIHWLTILTETEQHLMPHEFPDALLISGGFLYARAVVRYGSFVGRPLAQRSLFYLTLVTLIGLTLFYLALILDHWLMDYTPFPYPLVTGILVLVVVTGYPTISRWVIKRLDPWLFRAELEQRELAHHLVEALAEAPNPEQLQAELLDTLCTVLDVDKGYIALSAPNLPPDTLIIHAVHGSLPLRSGNLIHRPLYGGKPQLATTLLPQPTTEPGRQDMALFCPLTITEGINGILALGEKRDGKIFTSEEVTLCTDLARQLNTVGWMIHLRQQRDYYLKVAHLQDQALGQLEVSVMISTRQVLNAWEDRSTPIEIRMLGPLQVTRDGQLIAETIWSSEKAKALLAYLLWKSPNSATREELSQVLWPNRPVEETANVFHVTLHRLRRVFNSETGRGVVSDYILCDRGRYRFNTDSPYWLDVTTFQTLVRKHDDLDALRTAVNLYRGPYLEDTAWLLPCEVIVQQRELEQLYADALRRLAVQTVSREAAHHLERLLIIEPADETAQRALTLGYLSQGRGDLARRQVTRWQSVLTDLDLEPSPETIALWEIVKTRKVSE